MIYARIIVDEAGPALHILRPDAPPEVIRLTLAQLAALVAQGAAAVSEGVKRQCQHPPQRGTKTGRRPVMRFLQCISRLCGHG